MPDSKRRQAQIFKRYQQEDVVLKNEKPKEKIKLSERLSNIIKSINLSSALRSFALAAVAFLLNSLISNYSFETARTAIFRIGSFVVLIFTWLLMYCIYKHEYRIAKNIKSDFIRQAVNRHISFFICIFSEALLIVILILADSLVIDRIVYSKKFNTSRHAEIQSPEENVIHLWEFRDNPFDMKQFEGCHFQYVGYRVGLHSGESHTPAFSLYPSDTIYENVSFKANQVSEADEEFTKWILRWFDALGSGWSLDDVDDLSEFMDSFQLAIWCKTTGINPNDLIIKSDISEADKKAAEILKNNAIIYYNGHPDNKDIGDPSVVLMELDENETKSELADSYSIGDFELRDHSNKGEYWHSPLFTPDKTLDTRAEIDLQYDIQLSSSAPEGTIVCDEEGNEIDHLEGDDHSFRILIPKESDNVSFSVNCILKYRYRTVGYYKGIHNRIFVSYVDKPNTELQIIDIVP